MTAAHLAGGFASSLAAAASRSSLFLGSRAALLVDLQHRLVHKLSGTEGARGRLLVCSQDKVSRSFSRMMLRAFFFSLCRTVVVQLQGGLCQQLQQGGKSGNVIIIRTR